MKCYLLLLTFLFPFLLVSQDAGLKEIPSAVQKSFNKRFPRSTDVSWDLIDGNYKADFIFKERLSYAEFKPDGEWVMTIVDQDLYNLYPPIEKYITDNYQKYKVLFVEKAMRADKDDYYYAQLSKKVRGEKEPVIIELFFDNTGLITQVKKPEGMDDMTVPGVEEPETVIPGEVTNSWKKRFPNAEQLSWTTIHNPSDSINFNYIARFIFRGIPTKAEFLPNGLWLETRQKLESSNLYTPVARYLEEHYRKDPLLIAEKVTRHDRNDYYFVKIEHQEIRGEPALIFDLYFDKSGKIQNIVRPEESKNQYLLTVDLPDAVGRKFNSRFARAEDVTWEKEDTVCTANFIYREKFTTAQFSVNGMWIETVEELDTRSLYAPIQRYIDQNYRDYRVSYAEKATRHDRNDYYYIELIAKKKSTQPHQVALYFDKTGRPRQQ